MLVLHLVKGFAGISMEVLYLGVEISNLIERNIGRRHETIQEHTSGLQF